jgi:hypothetical protein
VVFFSAENGLPDVKFWSMGGRSAIPLVKGPSLAATRASGLLRSDSPELGSLRY